MNLLVRAIHTLLLPAILLVLPGCRDKSADEPPAADPSDTPGPVETELTPNTTIGRLKELYWRDDADYTDSVAPYRAGRHVVIAGCVVSSDESLNISNCLVVQDTTAAVAITFDSDRLFQRYPVGQEVIIDVTGMAIGRVATLMHISPPNGSAKFFDSHTRLTRSPDAARIDTLLIRIPDLNATAENFRRMQSRLVRINNISFNEGGATTFISGNTVASYRDMRDKPGNTICLRTAGDATFGKDTLPAGLCDIVGILATAPSDGRTVRWHILPRSKRDILNIRPPEADTASTVNPDTIPPGAGTESEPYSVSRAIAIGNEGEARNVYVAGIIVGSVNGQDPKTDSRFSADYPSALNILISDHPATTDVTACMPVQLPYGALRSALNLAANPDNIGRKVILCGDIGSYLGIPGLRSTSSYAFGE